MDVFQTTDSGMAAFLLAKRHRMVEVAPPEMGSWRVHFIFPDSPEIQADAKEFLEDGLIQARSLLKELAHVRRAIQEYRDNQTKGSYYSEGNKS